MRSPFAPRRPNFCAPPIIWMPNRGSACRCVAVGPSAARQGGAQRRHAWIALREGADGVRDCGGKLISLPEHHRQANKLAATIPPAYAPLGHITYVTVAKQSSRARFL